MGLAKNVTSAAKARFRLRLRQTARKNPAKYRKLILLGFFACLPRLSQNLAFSLRSPFSTRPIMKAVKANTIKPNCSNW